MAKIEKAKVRYLLPEEERRLSPIIAKDKRLWPYYILGLHTGMRVSEIAAIRVCDVIIYPKPMIFIPHSKSSRSRYVPLWGPALEIVVNRVQSKNAESLLLEGIYKKTVSSWFKSCCEEARMPDFTFHCLRHTFAAHMLSQGARIYKVSKILGHSSVVVTEQHYGHLDKSELTDEIRHIQGIVTLPNVTMEAAQAVNEAVNSRKGMSVLPE